MEFLCRTAVTSMRISLAPVLKSGDKRMAKSPVSLLVPVSLGTLLPPSDAKLSKGTGGTIAGTGQFLKSMADDILVVLADPEGSGLYNKVSQSGCSISALVTDTAVIKLRRSSTESCTIARRARVPGGDIKSIPSSRVSGSTASRRTLSSRFR